jgi:hypothetical protein
MSGRGLARRSSLIVLKSIELNSSPSPGYGNRGTIRVDLWLDPGTTDTTVAAEFLTPFDARLMPLLPCQFAGRSKRGFRDTRHVWFNDKIMAL